MSRIKFKPSDKQLAESCSNFRICIHIGSTGSTSQIPISLVSHTEPKHLLFLNPASKLQNDLQTPIECNTQPYLASAIVVNIAASSASFAASSAIFCLASFFFWARRSELSLQQALYIVLQNTNPQMSKDTRVPLPLVC